MYKNNPSDKRVVNVLPQAFAKSSVPWKIIAAFLLAAQFAAAQDYAPASLAIGSTISSISSGIDTLEGSFTDTTDIVVTSATAFQATQDGFVSSGTYTYTKTSGTKATLTYTSNYSEPGYTETETATVLITFTNYGVGTLSSSGSYSGNSEGTPFNGSFTSTGTFTYNGPTIGNVTDKSTSEDTATAAISFTIGDGQTAAASLTVTRASSNTTLVPLANIVLGGSGNNRTVTITPAANQSGTATMTLTVSDGTLTVTDTFLLTVNAVNDAPTISDVTDRSTTPGTSSGAISFTVGDLETAATSLTVTRTSSNTTLVPLANVVLGGSGANRTVTVTPAGSLTGTATITLTVSDGSLNTSDTFVLTVNASNTAPTISDVTDKSTSEDNATAAISFTIGDGQTAAASLTVTRASSNTTLVPLANIVLGGSGTSRTVTITPAANQSGTATITLTVSDGTLTVTDTFLLTVNAVNDAPTISNVTDASTNKNTATPAIAFTVGDIETTAGSLTLSAASSNPALVSVGNIVFGGSGASRTVTITPASNQSGVSTITLTVSDGVQTATDTFVLTVLNQESLSNWRLRYFSSANNSGDGADLNDFDKDGLVNLLEYALGGDPKDPASGKEPPVDTEEFDGQPYLTITIPKSPSVSGITYVVEVSDTLGIWQSGPAHTTIITDDATTLKVRDNSPAIGGSGFIRLKVVAQ